MGSCIHGASFYQLLFGFEKFKVQETFQKIFKNQALTTITIGTAVSFDIVSWALRRAFNFARSVKFLILIKLWLIYSQWRHKLETINFGRLWLINWKWLILIISWQAICWHNLVPSLFSASQLSLPSTVLEGLLFCALKFRPLSRELVDRAAFSGLKLARYLKLLDTVKTAYKTVF